MQRIPDKEERAYLGVRARARREEVGLSREAVGSMAGIDPINLMSWERSLPRKWRASEDLWEDAIGVPRGWLRNTRLAAPKAKRSGDLQCPPCASIADEMRVVGTYLVRANEFRRTLEFDALTASEQRNVGVFSMRYGTAGEDASTLQATGARFQITSERARQIVETLVQRAAGMSLCLPLLESLHRDLEPLLPAPLAELDERFRPILGEDLSIESVSRFAREVLGRPFASTTDRPANMHTPWVQTVVSASESLDHEIAKAIRENAMALIRANGAAQVMIVVGMASEALGKYVGADAVLQNLRLMPGFEWLVEDLGWFWFGPQGENRLITVAKKILSVANRNVDSEEILAGMIASRRRKYGPEETLNLCLFELPLFVAKLVLKRIPGIACIQQDDFALTDSIDPATVLSDVEQALVDCIRSHGGVAAKWVIHQDTVGAGKCKFGALQMAVEMTPILVRLDVGLYGLRGYSIDTGAMDTQAAMVWGGQASAIVASLEPDGLIRYPFRLSEYSVRTRMFTVPVQLGRMLKTGHYELVGAEGTVVYRDDHGKRRFTNLVGNLLTAGFGVGSNLVMMIDVARMRMEVTQCDTESDASSAASA